MSRSSVSNLFSAVVASCALLGVGVSAAHAAPLTWSTAYAQVSSTTNQLRAVEVADQSGNDSVYAGFIQAGNNRNVLRFDTDSPYALLDSRGVQSNQPKAIASDSRGYVYVGNRISGGSAAFIASYNANLGTPLDTESVTSDQFGGLATAEFGGNYYLYASREASNEIRRYIANDPSNLVLDTTFGTSGVYTLGVGSGELRGLDVANDGTIFVTNRASNGVYRISSDLSTVTSASVTRAMDVALFGGKAYVTSYNGASSSIAVFDASTLTLVDTITISLLDALPYTRGGSEGWGGIDIGPDGRIWLGDQAYQSSGTTRDRLLVSTPIPEPATWLLAAMGAVALICVRRRTANR
jgi:hypothetical protein